MVSCYCWMHKQERYKWLRVLQSVQMSLQNPILQPLITCIALFMTTLPSSSCLLLWNTNLIPRPWAIMSHPSIMSYSLGNGYNYFVYLLLSQNLLGLTFQPQHTALLTIDVSFFGLPNIIASLHNLCYSAIA